MIAAECIPFSAFVVVAFVWSFIATVAMLGGGLIGYSMGKRAAIAKATQS